MLDTYQQPAQMLSRPDNTVPNWQKVRAVHLNMKVGCVSYTNQCFLSPPQNRNQAKWDIRVTQIPCDGSNLLQVNIKIVFEDWNYSFKLTCNLQAPAGCGQYFTARSGNISSLNWKDGTYLKWISLHSLNTFHNLLIQGTPTLPPVSNRTSEPVPFNTISKGKVTFLKQTMIVV